MHPRRALVLRLAVLAASLAVAVFLLAAPVAAKRQPQAPAGSEVEKTAQDKGKPPQTRAELLAGSTAIPGLLTFHRSPEKLYLELPAELLEAPLGFSAALVRAVGDFVPRGSSIETVLVRWSRVGERLVLAKETTDFRAAPGSGFDEAVRESFPRSPVFNAPLVRLSDAPSALLVEASKLFGPGLAQVLSPVAGASPDPDGTILESLRAFPDNVVARVRFRYQVAPNGGDGGGDNPFLRYQRPARLADPRSFEVTVDFHFYRLPESGYRPRPADDRIGAFTRDFKDYTGIDDRDTAFRHVVTRFDLRKADPTAAVSDPIAPIVFYLDRSIPREWRPLVREGALWWNPAFEKAGIRRAIEVRDPPEDPDWDPADLRHNVIYWNLTDDLVFSGLAGPMFADPRTGQALKAVVYLNAEFFSFARHRYLVYAWWRAPEPGTRPATAREELALRRRDPFFCDRQASFSSQMAFARLVLGARGVLRPGTPEADRFAREAFLELAAHEVGHALGFPHNWKASLAPTWEDVRDNRVSGRQGENPFSTSVMDYDPIYLSPKGRPQGDYFLHGVGAYDELQVEYLYRPFDHLSPEDEARELDRIAAKAETERGLIYDGGELNAIDPTTNADDLGDDPLSFAASRLALIHDEVLPVLPKLVLAEGHDYNHLRAALDSAIFSVALDYVDMIARQVGGQVLLRRVANSPASPAGGDPPIVPISAGEQRRALETLDRHLFAEGLFALPPETLALLKADLQYDWNYPWRFASDYDLGKRVEGLYEAALSTLLEPARLARVRDNERRVAAGQALTLPELFAHLEATAFAGGGVAVGADRRALQRRVVDRFAALALAPPAGTPPEAPQVAAWSLRSIARRLDKALAGGGRDAYTEAHFQDLAARIRRTLEARVEVPGS